MNNHKTPCPQDSRLTKLETQNIQYGKDINGLKNEDNTQQQDLQKLSLEVSNLSGIMNTLKWILGLGLPILILLLSTLIGLLITNF